MTLHEAAPNVTACIPTVGEAEDVTRTVKSLLRGEAVPAAILVSNASGAEFSLSTVRRELDSADVPAGVECRLLPPPPRGTTTGNRNWLARHVGTPLLLFLDDEVDIHPGFVRDALVAIADRGADVVVAASTSMGGSGWFTTRGHFRPIQRGDPIAVGLACSLWRADLFRSLWLDERINYGYEDADLSFRLHQSQASTVEQSPHDFVHRSDGTDLDPVKDASAERARGYVSAKRHAKSRRSLVHFLILEMSCNVIRGRPLLPRGQVRGQWQRLAKYVAGGEPPSWVDGRTPLLTETRREGES